MDTNYEFYIDDDIGDVELLEDTEKILSVLYTDYLVTDEERDIIKKKEKILQERANTEASYINIKEIFLKKTITKTEENKE